MKRSLLLLLLAGCGDNLAAHGTDAGAGDAPRFFGGRGVVVAGDFNSAGLLTTVDTFDLTVKQDQAPGAVGDDPYLRLINGDRVVINRDKGDNITLLSDTAPLAQVATGVGSNPQDVARHGDKFYVPALGTAGVVVVGFGGGPAKTISLASLDPDGKPDCVSAYTVGDRIFVACGILDSTFTPRGPGKVAVIDALTDTVVTSFDLPFANPQGMFVQTPDTSMYGGDLLIATAPSFTDYSTGCIARVGTGPQPAAHGCAVTNQVANGFPSHMDVFVGSETLKTPILWMAMTHYDAAFNATGQLRRLDLTTGELSYAISPASQQIVDVAVCPDSTVLVADHAAGSDGLRVYRDGVEVTTAALPIGLPPGFGNGLVCYMPSFI